MNPPAIYDQPTGDYGLLMNANEAWIAMIRRIPGSLHDAIALGLTTGVEIVVQKIVRLEPDFMILRGRLAGTQDTGRAILVPYAQLTFVAITRELKDPELEEIFGKAAPAAIADAPAAPAHAAPAEPVSEAKPETPPPEPPKKPEPASRASLVAKLRERIKDKQ